MVSLLVSEMKKEEKELVRGRLVDSYRKYENVYTNPQNVERIIQKWNHMSRKLPVLTSELLVCIS